MWGSALERRPTGRSTPVDGIHAAGNPCRAEPSATGLMSRLQCRYSRLSQHSK